MTRTKIICTIGPACNSYEKIVELCKAGMNVARLNFSHGTHDEHLLVINHLKKARHELNIPLAIMMDTKGPEIRIGKIHGGEISLQKGDHLTLVDSQLPQTDPKQIPIIPGNILKLIPMGTQILFDDGYISSHVVGVDETHITVEIDNQGLLLSGKGVNIPNFDLQLPAMTEKDIEDICFGCKNDIDLIAASFVRSPEHVMVIKNLLARENKPEIQVIAKIENSEGIRNFDSIVLVADGIMIARGDLGVEVPLSEVPRLQKMMIRKSYLAGKLSVTATQMLESMIYHPRPTRAEVSDVANAIYDGTSAVMLSGETAIGRYPLDVVNIMKSIIKDTEEDVNYRLFFDNFRNVTFQDVPSAVTLAVVKTVYSLNGKAVFIFTTRGSTAKLISRLRPEIPIIAMTANQKCYHQMAINWGVIPFFQEGCHSVLEAFQKISDYALSKNLVSLGNLVVVTAGVPFGTSGTTNTMMVESIGEGEILIRGKNGYGKTIYGNIKHVFSPELTHSYTIHGQILVITRCDETYLPLIQESSGVILQNISDDKESERCLLDMAKQHNKPVITGVDTAFRVLVDGQLVTLDPEKKVVYKGAVL